MIRLPDGDFKTVLEQIFTSLKLSQSQIISSSLNLYNSHFLGYLITTQIQDELKGAVTEALMIWKQKIESRRILRLGLEYPIVSLDPRVGGDHFSSLVLKMLFEGLMRENRDGKIEYGIAKSVEISSDLTTYLFKLNPTYWSDGSLVTAFDFEYAWKKVLSPTFKTPFAYLFYPIKNAELAKNGMVPTDAVGVQALDGSTLKVELESPTPYFLELTAHSIYSPVHRLIDQLRPNWSFEEGKAYVCNGAFQLTKNSPSQGYELIKNPIYWDAENIQLDQASFLKVTRYQAFEMFEKNNNYWVGMPLSTWNPSFIPSEQDEPVNCLIEGVCWYVFNCKKPPFNHKKMRQAFSMAIDRVQLASFFNTNPAISPLPAAHSFVEQSHLPPFNPQKAKILFKEALEELSLSEEQFTPLTLMYLTGNTANKLAETIKNYWETTFGIRCSPLPLEWNTLFSKITEGNYQIGCLGWQPWINDPMYTLNVLRDAKDPMNFPKWENKKYQDILHLAEREINPEKRQEYYSQAEAILLDETPIAPISSSITQNLKKKNLKIKNYSGLINFKWAHFEV
jgi:oligopeptide transport system substrate-binding protein